MEKCLVCNTTNNRVLFRVRQHDIRQCGDCQVRFISPLPKRSELKRLYEQVHGNGDYTAGNGRYIRYADPAVTRSKRFNFQRNLREVLDVCDINGARRLLEIGCASGLFLSIAQPYFAQVFGIDLAENGVDQVPGALRSCVSAGSLEDFNLPAHSFDVVALWDTFEHLLDPVGTLQRAHNLLDPEHGLLALTTPNSGSACSRFFGRRWRLLLPPLHVTYFNKVAMRNILDRCGFEPIRMTTPWGFVAFKHMVYMVNVMTGYNIPDAVLTKLTSLPFRDRLVPINFGDIMLVLARPKRQVVSSS